jgi:hypothetical protein
MRRPLHVFYVSIEWAESFPVILRGCNDLIKQTPHCSFEDKRYKAQIVQVQHLGLPSFLLKLCDWNGSLAMNFPDFWNLRRIFKLILGDQYIGLERKLTGSCLCPR